MPCIHHAGPNQAQVHEPATHSLVSHSADRTLLPLHTLQVQPKPYISPIPYPLSPIPDTLYPIPYTLYNIPYTLNILHARYTQTLDPDFLLNAKRSHLSFLGLRVPRPSVLALC
jgi:hypothetical protein